jgi:hypothetical protein
MPFCTHCGAQVTEEGVFCSHCGKNKTASGSTGGTAVAVHKTESEKTFLSVGGATVTNSRIILDNKTYAMAGLTSVRSTVIPAKRGWAILTALVGLILLVGGDTRAFGVFTLAVGLVWAFSLKDQYAVTINSASGELHALTSKSQMYIDDIVAAINQAIVYRS